MAARENQDPNAFGECHDCGLVQRIPEADGAALVRCGRCHATLRQVRQHSVALTAVCAACGLVLFALAFMLPTADVWMQGGRYATADLVTGPQRFSETGAWQLALVVVFTLLILPFAKLAIALAMAVHLRSGGEIPRWLKASFTSLPVLSQWAMIDVFLLGATIALFRLRVWMVVSFGPSMFALGGAALCSLAVDATVDRVAFWRLVPPQDARPGVTRDASFPLVACHGCGLLLQSPEGGACPRCERRLHSRKTDSVRRTWALVATAALLAVPANVLPVMTIIELGRGGPSTILGGTLELLHVGLWGLALLVFVASILVPLFKLVALSYLLITTARGSAFKLKMRTKIYRVVALIGRWSMLDIFATMMLVTLARFGWIGNVMPGLGATAFCAVVLITMLASESFDPRLMWDAAGHNAENSNLELPS